MSVATHEIAAVGAHLNEVYPMLPFTPVRGIGVYLENAAGRRILDLYGGHAVAALGYGHRDLSDTLARASRELVFQTNALPLKVRDEAAEKLAAFGPPGLGRVFFVNSGAEANDNALRLAFKVTGRPKVVAMEHSFHGRTAAAAAVTYGAAKSWYGFPRTPFDVVFVPRNDIAALDAAVDSSTAAVIIEPVQGLAGAFDFAPEFLRAVRVACDRVGALMILDEVQTGMGRTGKLFAHEWAGITPDIMAIAKGIGGGFPVGAFLATEEAAKGMTVGTHGSTYGGNPLAMAVANAVLDVVLEPGFLDNVQAKALRLKQALARVQDEHSDEVIEVRGMGLLTGIRVKRPSADVIGACLAERLLTAGAGDNVVRLLAPLNVGEAEISEGADRLSRALRRLAAAPA
jgi:acetylornithine/succinyldiaminopimelate/putrescine aminotransferase